MKLFDYIFLIFLVVMSFDPTGYFSNAKEILFIILVGYGLFKLGKNNRSITNSNALIIVSFIILPIYGIFVSEISGNMEDTKYAISHIKSLLFIFLFLYVTVADVKNVFKAFWINGVLLSIVTSTLLVLTFMNDVLFTEFWRFGYESGIYMTADRSFLGIPIKGIYFRAGPLILVSFYYNLYIYNGRFRFLFTCLMLGSLILCGSRTPMLVICFLFFVYLKDKKILGAFLTGLLSFILVCALLYVAFLLATETGEGSNEIKYSNARSYIDDIFSGAHALFGAGLGSTFYAIGNGTKLAFSELSYMDILRIYGIFLGSYMIFLFYLPYLKCRPYFHCSIRLKRFFLMYVLFMILAGTNPLLIGPFGLSVLILGMKITSELPIQQNSLFQRTNHI